MVGRTSLFMVVLTVLALCVGCFTTQTKENKAAAKPAKEAKAQVAPAKGTKAPAEAPKPAAGLEQAAPAAAPAQPAEPVKLAVLQTIKIGGEGRWDLLTVDARNHRVYIARSTRVEVIDTEKGTVVGEVEGVTGAHGVAVAGRLGLGFATAGRDNTINVFDLKTLQTTKKIPSGQRPDAILYDSATGKVFAFNGGSNDATVVKASALDEAPTSIPLGGKPEVGVADGQGHVFVNLEDKSCVVAIDSTGEKVIGTWELAPGTEPTGLAYSGRRSNLLFAACANQMMIVLDAATGKVVANVPTGSGPDGAAFDRAVGAISPNGRDGTITVVRETSPGKFEAVQTLTTAKGARTIAGDRMAHTFYLPCMIGEGDQAAFSLLVVGPAK